MKKFFEEFKAFISRGNVMDMAVGVIIASAFGAITSTLVEKVVMPVIGLIFGGQDLTNALNWTVRPAVTEMVDGVETVVKEATVIGFGDFLAAVINFVIIAFIVFCIVKAFNRARAAMEKKKAEEPAAEPEPTKEELLLTEIRDLLKEKK
ncbi:MAG: large-conductance mechanosensitive channel protein MscL [Oscillospiraceae bacterium]|nr:large-conductance mechanosensitive channel protein MscL [Oscillospiraceae bacterium]